MPELKNILRIFLLVFLGVALSFMLVGKKQINNRNASAVSIPVTLPVEKPVSSRFETKEMVSPDGTKNLILEKQTEQDKINYAVLTKNVDEDNETEILVKDADVNYQLEIPHNAWSPDNVYFFLKQYDPATEYLVFFSSGEIFKDDTRYLSVKKLFSSKYPEFEIEDITGWTAVNLLLLNTKSQNGEKISFWFEVPSQSFTRLGTYFE